MKKFFSQIKEYFLIGKEWFMTNKDYKVIGISSVIGLLTFSSWSAFFLGLLCGGLIYLINTQIPNQYLNLINIDFKKYIINAIIGLVIASAILMIF